MRAEGTTPAKSGLRIAILGGGVSGLVAARLLAERHDVQLFEAATHLGGHTYTVPVVEGDRTLALDMGFIVFNDRTYPNFLRLLAELGVESEPSAMSFSVRCERSGLEYNGSSLNQLFAQRRNLLRPSFHRLLIDLLRFHRVAARPVADDLTLGDFLARERFAGPFVEQYLIPMTAAVWSTEPRRMLDFPARTLLAFLANHGMASIFGRPQWRVVRGGSQRYVEALAAPLAGRLAVKTPVEWVRRRPDGVEVKVEGAAVAHFDRVVIATHSDQALALLADASAAEHEILGAIPYQTSDVVLHTDVAMLPRRRRAWASWNYHLNTPTTGPVQVTYYMNRLQNLVTARPYCVTLNRTSEIDPAQVLHQVRFAHPLYTRAGIAAQERWHEIHGGFTYYCGAYWGYGFHEDGVRSALRVAAALGVDVSQAAGSPVRAAA